MNSTERELRRYTGATITQLALAYLPHDEPRAARRCLRRWLMRNEALFQQLKKSGFFVFRQGGKRLTRSELEPIFAYLGPP